MQVHGMDADPIFVGDGDLEAALAMIEEAKKGEFFLYSGNLHIFADSSLPSCEEDASALLFQRVLEFLSAL